MERTTGLLPISIATSLAIESLNGVGEFSDRKSKINNYREIWFNIDTLFRNTYNSIDKDIRLNISVPELTELLHSDMLILVSYLEKESSVLKPIFYYRDYLSLNKQFKHANLTEPKTTNQFVYEQTRRSTLESYLSNEFNGHLNIVIIKDKISSPKANALILTHHPVDLLNREYFSNLTLLESHTGSLKRYLEWNTKLTASADRKLIPFNKLTLQVFGDKSIDFKGCGIKVRRSLLSIAKENKWKPNTTKDKIKYSFNKTKDREYIDLFKDLVK